MPNRVFDELVLQHFRDFEYAFSDTAKKVFFDQETGHLRHPGEYGTYRETICKNLLRLFIPMRLDIGQGFLMNPSDEVSTQCDIVVYDSRVTPMIQTGELHRFYPVESVCAVGEVKSTPDKQELRQALAKLAAVKRLAERKKQAAVVHRATSGDYDPAANPFDQLFTFLICDSFNFRLTNRLDWPPANIEPRHRHNVILSLKDGVILYALGPNQPDDGMHVYPVMVGRALSDAVLTRKEAGPDVFRVFAHYLFQATSNATILWPDMIDYLTYPSEQ